MEKIKLTGKIKFEPINLTKKHNKQASWKRIMMIMVDGEIDSYYRWFIKKRYNLYLNPPQRGAHITVINDRVSDIDIKLFDKNWKDLKTKLNNTPIEFELDLDVRTDGFYWWFNLTPESILEIQKMRDVLGLKEPFFKFHLTIGYCREGVQTLHGEYIHDLIKKGFINT